MKANEKRDDELMLALVRWLHGEYPDDPEEIEDREGDLVALLELALSAAGA